MSTSSVVTLASLRLSAQLRADMANSTYLATYEWNQNISRSYKELYDLLVAAYGNDYYMATPYPFTTDGVNQFYALPTDFYKLLGVDMSLSGRWVTLKPFNFAERNRYAYPSASPLRTKQKYRLAGNQIWFQPLPTGSQNFQLFYAPEPSSLQVEFMGSTLSTTTVNTTLTTGITVGMVIAGPGIVLGTTITAVTTNTSVTLSQAATATASPVLLFAYDDTVTIDGISGWEEYAIVDAAIKGKIKEETETADLMSQKKQMYDRLTTMASDRDIGMPSTVTDVYASNGYGEDDCENGGDY